jgi:hypothetical protein
MTPTQTKLLFRALWIILVYVRPGGFPNATASQIERDLKEEGGL